MKPKNPFLIEGSSEDVRLGKRMRMEWIAESSPTRDDHERDASTHYLGRALSDTRLFAFMSVTIALIFLFLARVAYMQLVTGDVYNRLAEENRLRTRLIVPERGIITDRRGVPLATNIANFVLLATPADLPESADERRRILMQLTKLGFSAETIDAWAQRIASIPHFSLEARQPMILTDRIRHDQAVRFATFTEQHIGLHLELEPIRSYPLSTTVPSLSHVLGYLGRIIANEYEKLDQSRYTFADRIGRQGIEASHEDALRGIPGIDRFEVDARGVIQTMVSRVPAQPGKTLQLTIDAGMQQLLEDRLRETLKTMKRTRGAAIALDPRDGAIRALVSIPAYDNNLFAQGITQRQYETIRDDPAEPLFPRAIAGEYPSGSTIKPVIAAAALAEGLITPTTSFLSQGGIAVSVWFFPDWKKGGHGMTNIYKAIAESVNTYFYIIGGGYRDFAGLGIDRIIRYATRFGLGQKLGIDLPGERTGFLPTPAWKERVKGEQWYIGDTYHLAIGQGDLLVTPLQVALWTSVFANGGTLYRPRLIERYVSVDGKEIETAKPDIIRNNVVDPEVIRVIRRAMRETVLTGSARRLQDLRVTSAGKTGTAEWSSKKDPHAWFTAFAPYENPEIVVTVLIEEGKEGSSSALPVVDNFLTWYFRSKTINPKP